MATKIQWTDESWNPIIGCTKISPGCANCYAEIMCKRFWKSWGYEPPPHHFKVKFHEKRIYTPSRWRKPRRVFVCSMGDLFHWDVQDKWIDRIISTIASCNKHIFQILTKRPERMFKYFDDLANLHERPEVQDRIMRGGHIHYQGFHSSVMKYRTGSAIPNLWLGTSVEDQKTADNRIPWLLKTPAAIRFVSYEPALEKVSFDEFLRCPKCSYTKRDAGIHLDHHICGGKIPEGLHQIIMGSESGPKARPFDMDWARDIRDQCQMAGIAFFLKQAPVEGKIISMPLLDGKVWDEMPKDVPHD